MQKIWIITTHIWFKLSKSYKFSSLSRFFLFLPLSVFNVSFMFYYVLFPSEKFDDLSSRAELENKKRNNEDRTE